MSLNKQTNDNRITTIESVLKTKKLTKEIKSNDNEKIT